MKISSLFFQYGMSKICEASTHRSQAAGRKNARSSGWMSATLHFELMASGVQIDVQGSHRFLCDIIRWHHNNLWYIYVAAMTYSRYSGIANYETRAKQHRRCPSDRWRMMKISLLLTNSTLFYLLMPMIFAHYPCPPHVIQLILYQLQPCLRHNVLTWGWFRHRGIRIATSEAEFFQVRLAKARGDTTNLISKPIFRCSF